MTVPYFLGQSRVPFVRFEMMVIRDMLKDEGLAFTARR